MNNNTFCYDQKREDFDHTANNEGDYNGSKRNSNIYHRRHHAHHHGRHCNSNGDVLNRPHVDLHVKHEVRLSVVSIVWYLGCCHFCLLVVLFWVLNFSL